LADVWSKTLEELKKEFPAEFFEPFLQSLRPVDRNLTGNRLILQVPNKKIIPHLQDKYLEMIHVKLKRITGKEINVELTLSDPPEADIKQLTLYPMWLNPDYNLESYIQGASNEAALKIVLKQVRSKKGGGIFYFFGESGSGKTHLLNIAAHELLKQNSYPEMVYLNVENFKEKYIHERKKSAQNYSELKGKDILFVDDVQLLFRSPSPSLEKFYFIFNDYFDRGKSIFITSDRPAGELSLPTRLKNRLMSCVQIPIWQPDLEMSSVYLERRLDGLNLAIDDDIKHYIISDSHKLNFRLLDSLINTIYFHSQSEERICKLSDIEENLNLILHKSKQHTLPIELILEAVCEKFKISIDELTGTSRKTEYTLPRHMAMYIAILHTGLNKSAIARVFKKGDHTTVIHAEKKMKKMVQRDSSIRLQYENLMNYLWINRG